MDGLAPQLSGLASLGRLRESAPLIVVITGLVPVIHAVFAGDTGGAKYADGRNRSGHDE